MITGGANARGPLSGVELFGAPDEVVSASPMLNPRYDHVCAALANGAILVAGGRTAGGGLTNAAEVYNPDSGAWTAVEPMTQARADATATVLSDGRILIAGGYTNGSVSNALEIYDPASRSFSQLSAILTSPRVGHAAAALRDGRVLIAGGSDGVNPLKTVDILDPASATVSDGLPLPVARVGLSATTLLDGNVFIAGGSDGIRELASALVFDVKTWTYSAVLRMGSARRNHLAISLPGNGAVLLAGGGAAGLSLNEAELYVPWQHKFVAAPSLGSGRLAAAAGVWRGSGTVLIAGGRGHGKVLSSSETYSYATLTSDKSDYHPGETVILTGSGWLPGETVQMVLSVDPKTHANVKLTSVADQDGRFVNRDYVVRPKDLGVTFYVTSLGLTSGRTAALLAFTDSSGDGTMTVSPGTVNANQAGLSLTFTFFTTTSFTSTNSRVRVTVPAGWTSPSTSNVRVTNTNCASVSLTSASFGVITAGISCPANTGFTITYGVSGSYVTAPGSAQNSTFTTTTRRGSLFDINITAQPVVSVVGAPARLAFSTQPGGGNADSAWTQQPRVAVQDSAGHTITGAANMVTLAIGINPGGGSLTCTTNPLAASSGLASFAGCRINRSGTGYTLTASASGLTGATSSPFNVTAGAAARLIFSQQPGGGTGGTAWTTQPRVTVQDANGNTVTSPSFSVTLAVANNPVSGVLSCSSNPVATSSGVAAFSSCRIDKAGNGYTLQATSGALSLAASNAFNITVGPATRLGFTTQPGGGSVSTAWTAQPRVAIQDAGGNTVISASRTITLSIVNNPGSGTLACPPAGLSAITFSGVATFAGCNINRVGNGYTIRAASSGNGISSATSSAFNITAGAAARLVFTTQPGNGSGGSNFSTQPVVAIQDANGNTVAADTSSVTLTIASNPGGGALTCSANPVNAVTGVATFAGCRIDKIGNGYTLTATDGTLTPATSNSFNITTGAAVQLGFTTQPNGGTAAVAWSSQPVVALQDAGGNTVTTTSRTITLAISNNPGSGALACPPAGLVINTSSGVARFAGCNIDKSGTGYTLRATASGTGISAVTSSAFNVDAGPAAQLVFTTQPGSGTGGSNLSAQPVVAIRDANGNTVMTDTSLVTLAIANNPSAGMLSCGVNPVAAVNGVATFSGCKINRAGTGYTLRASDGTLSSATSNLFNITPGPAAQLVFSTQPGGGTAATAWTAQPVVTVQDAGGNTVTNDTSSVRLTIANNPGAGALTCTANPMAAVAGVASFTGCRIDRAATGYQLQAVDGSLAGATSDAFDIVAGPAAKLAITTQPAGGVAGIPWPIQPVVTVQDAAGNTAVADTSNVTLTISTNPGGGALTCTANPKSAVAGVAMFAGCWVDRAGAGYVLRASDGLLTSATSSSFDVTAGAAAKLAFTTQPGGGAGGAAWLAQPVVTVQDASGNTVASDTSAVTLSISANAGDGVLTCNANPQPAVAGIAAFSACAIDKAGAGYRLQATAGSLTPAVSASFDILASGAPARLVFTTQPGGGLAGSAWLAQPIVAVQDAAGHTITTDTSNISLTIANNPAGGVLTCTVNPKPALAGVAAFTGCNIDRAGSGYTLLASDGLLTPVISSAFDIQPPGTAPESQPVVAIHVSELTRALESMPAGSSTPSGAGTTGYEWWTPWWHYFVMPDALQEALRSDGTPFAVVTDAQISAGQLLTSTGTPRYPIVISLAAEAVDDSELTPLRNYVSAGGYLMAGSAAFTRRPDGTSRGDFAFANEMGLHTRTTGLQNWQQNGTFTKQSSDPLVADIPSGTLSWMMPLTSDDTPLNISGFHAPQPYQYIWQATAAGATVLASGDNGVPYLAKKGYGDGYFIYHAAMQPLLGDGGYDSGMYAYVIFRRAIETAYAAAGLPIVKVSPWPYQYNAAYVVRHDFEDYQSAISSIESSAQYENSLGAKGDYYFCTGTLRVEMGNSQQTIDSLRRAVSLYGATIGSHNGGLRNPNNDLVVSDYDYWHWGPDEALDTQPPGYASGSEYASTSLSNSFSDLDSWLAGLNTNTRTWTSPYFNAAREESLQILDQLGVVTAGEQKLSPFPHWTISKQSSGKRYNFITLPVSDWYIGTDVAQALNFGFTTPTIHALVDYYYGLGALVNLYMHEPSTTSAGSAYVTYAAAQPAIWPANAVSISQWWRNRSTVQVQPTYAIVGNRMVVTTTVTGARDAGTAIELVIPNWALASPGLEVKLNGTPAGSESYRTYQQGLKILVGTTVSSVEVSFPLTGELQAQSDAYSVIAGNTLTVPAPGVLGNDNGFGAVLTAVLTTPPSNGVVNLSGDGSFTYTPANGFAGVDSFSYIAVSGVKQSGVTPVTIVVNPVGTVFSDTFSGPSGTDPLWTTVAGSWSVANGAINGSSSAGSYAFAYASGNWTDVSVQARVRFSAGAYGGGIGGRVDPSTGTHYGIWILPGSSTLEVVKFRNWGDWNGIPMAQATVPAVGTGWHTLLATFQGSRIRVSLDGTPFIDVTDNGFDARAPYAAGGISLDLWTDWQPYTMSVDDVIVQVPQPAAQDDTYTTGQGAVLNVPAPGVLGNDTSGGGETQAAALVDAPSHGTLDLKPDGSFTYTPESSFTGSDSFTYQAVTGGLVSNTARVTISVAPLSISSVTLDPSTVIGGTTSQGTVTLNAPAPDGIVVSLASSNPAAAAVPATVVAPPGSLKVDFPITNGAVQENTQLTITATYGASSQTAALLVLPLGSQVLFSDDFTGSGGQDPLWTTITGAWNLGNGVIAGSSAANSYAFALGGSPSWSDYSTTAQIQFPVRGYCGGFGGRVNAVSGAHYGVWLCPEGSISASAVVRVIKFRDWGAWNGTPMAEANLPAVGTAAHVVMATFQGSRILVSVDGIPYIDVVDNGYDSQPPYASGALSLDMWTDWSPYAMNVDNFLVIGLPAVPVASNDSYTMIQGGSLNIAAPGVLANDTGSGLTAALVSPPAHGTYSLQPDGSFSYIPDPGYTGADSFSYQANAGGVLSNVASVAIAVELPSTPSLTVNPNVVR